MDVNTVIISMAENAPINYVLIIDSVPKNDRPSRILVVIEPTFVPLSSVDEINAIENTNTFVRNYVRLVETVHVDVAPLAPS